jgi:hypothetical protein
MKAHHVIFLAVCCIFVIVTFVYNYCNTTALLAKGKQVHVLRNHSKNLLGTRCNRVELRKGEWVPRVYDRPPYVLARSMFRQSCPLYKIDQPWKTWEWNPDSDCVFGRWNSSLFCELAFNKTVLIIGDSTSLETFLSLTHLLGTPQLLPGARDKHSHIISRVCNNNTLLIGRRDFYLEDISKVIQLSFPDVIVLNRGSHFVPDEELLKGIRKNIAELRSWQLECSLQQRNCLLIWRTTVPGHPNCSMFTEPHRNITWMQRHIQDNPDNPKLKSYKWNQFQHQNELVLQEFSKSDLDYRVMDAHEINILRPDQHPSSKNLTYKFTAPDCLHNCAPGDEALSELLLHYMQM